MLPQILRAKPADLERIAAAGLPAEDRELNYYIEPDSDHPYWKKTEAELDWFSAHAELTMASRYSDYGPDYRIHTESENETADLCDLADRLTEILEGDERAEDTVIEVTIHNSALTEYLNVLAEARMEQAIAA